MGHAIGWGVILVLIGGTLNGSFAAPMKRLAAWKWENTWLAYSVIGLFIFPWIIAVSTVPHLASVYQQSSGGVLIKVAVFGLCWGIGSVLFGQGIDRVGLALTIAVVLGVASSIGSLLPLAILHPDQLGTRHGIALIAGTLVMVIGLALLTVAGKRRERDQAASTASAGRSGFVVGLIICCVSGIFSAMLNFAFVFGKEMQVLSLQSGASSAMSGNAIWALAVTVGFVPNAGYCIYLLNKNHTWGVFKETPALAGYTLGAAIMGVLWYGGIVVYGMGADALGALGGIIGWPVYLCIDLIAGVFWGFWGGEWKGASRVAVTTCLSGVGFLFLAIGVISMGNGG